MAFIQKQEGMSNTVILSSTRSVRWKQEGSSVMPKFKVGDEVVIINDDRYGVTTLGSVGIVCSNEADHEVYVQFKTIGKRKRPATEVDNYPIDIKDLDFLVSLTPQEQVIKKIREMEERRKPRPTIHGSQIEAVSYVPTRR